MCDGVRVCSFQPGADSSTSTVNSGSADDALSFPPSSSTGSGLADFDFLDFPLPFLETNRLPFERLECFSGGGVEGVLGGV